MILCTTNLGVERCSDRGNEFVTNRDRRDEYDGTPGLARALGAPLDPLERAMSAVVRVIDGAFDTRVAVVAPAPCAVDVPAGCFRVGWNGSKGGMAHQPSIPRHLDSRGFFDSAVRNLENTV